MSERKSGAKTLFMSVLMSAPGPLILGLGLLVGKSTTQIADFVRRSAELLGIIMAYIVYLMTNKNGVCNADKKERLERFSNVFVGLMMCLGGSLMLWLAVTAKNTEKGNVIPGLVIALLGVVANTLFWIKYRSLNKAEPNAILAVQARLYRAKSLVDGCVSIALLSVVLWPASVVSFYLDQIGSVVVSVYLIWCGIQTVAERMKKRQGGHAS